MATAATRRIDQAAPSEDWWRLAPEDVGERLGVDPAVGLSVERAAELLDRQGPNALPVEQPVPGWRRLVRQYRSYMQVVSQFESSVISRRVQT